MISPQPAGGQWYAVRSSDLPDMITYEFYETIDQPRGCGFHIRRLLHSEGDNNQNEEEQDTPSKQRNNLIEHALMTTNTESTLPTLDTIAEHQSGVTSVAVQQDSPKLKGPTAAFCKFRFTTASDFLTPDGPLRRFMYRDTSDSCHNNNQLLGGWRMLNDLTNRLRSLRNSAFLEVRPATEEELRTRIAHEQHMAAQAQPAPSIRRRSVALGNLDTLAQAHRQAHANIRRRRRTDYTHAVSQALGFYCKSLEVASWSSFSSDWYPDFPMPHSARGRWGFVQHMMELRHTAHSQAPAAGQSTSRRPTSVTEGHEAQAGRPSTAPPTMPMRRHSSVEMGFTKRTDVPPMAQSTMSNPTGSIMTTACASDPALDVGLALEAEFEFDHTVDAVIMLWEALSPYSEGMLLDIADDTEKSDEPRSMRETIIEDLIEICPAATNEAVATDIRRIDQSWVSVEGAGSPTQAAR
ncbi:uncharacterized protein MONBRDRAFT_32720 [Monosiga brevicollis MX1]|uniref:Uncharacterized protein n=1 Tax=Monosiga brevicollis TaxID=81824 RepID=A9V1A1_MONBE|nr:uncharacterized protein MONBRDRAFT_32720 [Monosiga brevicollis MX1]EDQ88896.1 predicted protein [Monosiga brevicollis MX1]|eukprot:XP_001746509.1 hypothetical protein [Monosiga brevicollis MX1]